MDREKLLAAVLVAGIAVLVFAESRPRQVSTVEFVENGRKLAEVSVEVADNKSERRQGLMFRETLCESCGMLFVYPGEKERSFWMKNTLIPLDMIFISKEMRVLNVETAYPQPNASDSELKIYRSEGEAKYVLEVNAGFAERKGIEEGTEVRFRR